MKAAAEADPTKSRPGKRNRPNLSPLKDEPALPNDSASWIKVWISAGLSMLVAVLGWIIHDIQVMKGNRYTAEDAKRDKSHQKEIDSLQNKRMDELQIEQRIQDKKIDDFQREPRTPK